MIFFYAVVCFGDAAAVVGICLDVALDYIDDQGAADFTAAVAAVAELSVEVLVKAGFQNKDSVV